jgi:hypothetical protein
VKIRESQVVGLAVVAEVQMGLSFRSRLENALEGNLAVIQMKDLMADNTVSCNTLVRVQQDNVKRHHLVQTGDLIFRSRGRVLTSAILVEQPDQVVVASPLLRVRVIRKERLCPKYLNWYISQPKAQEYLRSRQEGTHGGMISKKTLEELPIDIPPLEVQKIILEIAELSVREANLLGALAEKRRHYILDLMMRLAVGSSKVRKVQSEKNKEKQR